MLELAIVAAAYYGDSILSNLAAYYSNSERMAAGKFGKNLLIQVF